MSALPGLFTVSRRLALKAAGLLVVCVVLAGCRQRTPTSAVPTFPVHGALFIDEAPAAGATVKFIAANQSGRTPTAIVREDGTFSASFYDNEDGAPVGQYKLLVVWMQTPPEGGMAQDRLHGKFLDPQKPVATITLIEGVNQLKPLRLSTGTVNEASATK